MSIYTLITAALPYPNGELHLGHILEFIQADIWFRQKKQKNNKCFYLSGIDSHGTPIMLKAIKEKIPPEFLITKYFMTYKKTLKNFYINYDNFYMTNTYENEILVRKTFYKLYEKNLIFIKNIYQLFDSKLKIFLPDRYIIGTCPKCKIGNQYGDICEKCNYNYNAVDLIDPISILTNTKPIKVITKHYFFTLNKVESFLKNWCKRNINQIQILNKLSEWFKVGLKDWNISRDYPYFGIKIPAEYNKFFYVWLDAPFGYISSTQNYLNAYNINLIYELQKKKLCFSHFLGKDITYFHTLFWPAVLHSIKLPLPKKVLIHGFLTINNYKMSKSTGKNFLAEDILKLFNPDYIRFYFASKLNNNITDIDFNIEDFTKKINSDLIGKFINIFSRLSKIIIKNYDSILLNDINITDLFNNYIKINKIIKTLYEKCNYSKIIKIVMKYTDKINIYIDKEKPWYLCQNEHTKKRGHIVCTTGINLFLILLSYIKPIIPKISNDIEKLLKIHLNYNNLQKIPFNNIKIRQSKHITKKIIY